MLRNVILLVVAIAVQEAVDVGDQPTSKRARLGPYDDGSADAAKIADLPDAILVDIVQRLDPRSAARITATCRSLRRACAAAVVSRTLFHYEVPVSELPTQIAAFVRTADLYRNQITPEQCLGLYDRIVESGDLSWHTKIALLTVLARAVAQFAAFLLTLRIPLHWPQPEWCRLLLRLLQIPAASGTPSCAGASIPGSVLGIVQRSADAIAEAVRTRFPRGSKSAVHAVLDLFAQRYTAPFNRIAVRTEYVTNRLLVEIPDPNVLGSRGVLLALARRGLRFDLFEFLELVRPPPSSLPTVYPFLLKDRLTSNIGRFVYVRVEYQEPLLRIPECVALLQRDSSVMALYVAQMLHRYPAQVRKFAHLLRLDNRVLNAAILHHVNNINSLLRLPYFDLYTKADAPGVRNVCPLQLLYRNAVLVDRIVMNKEFCKRMDRETRKVLKSCPDSADCEFARRVASVLPGLRDRFGYAQPPM